MKFLLPIGGIVDNRFGILTSPAHVGVPAGIVHGMPWAADNDAFKRGFDPDRFFQWLETMTPYRDTCLFVTMPDVVGDAYQTLLNWKLYSNEKALSGWPLALVAQDGLQIDYENSTYYVGERQDFTDWVGLSYPELEPDDDPGYWDAMQSWRVEVFAEEVDVLFIGGSTRWKLSEDAHQCINFARQQGSKIHIGRVNWRRRYNHFALMEGSEEYTCDGTRTRFDGTKKSIRAWSGYMAQRPLHRAVLDGDRDG